MIAATGGYTAWHVYDIREQADSDYEVEFELINRWNKLKEEFDEIQPLLAKALRRKDAVPIDK